MGKQVKKKSFHWFPTFTVGFIVSLLLVTLWIMPARESAPKQVQTAIAIEPWLERLVYTTKTLLSQYQSRLPDDWLLGQEDGRNRKEEIAKLFVDKTVATLDRYYQEDEHVEKLRTMFRHKLVPGVYGDPIAPRYPEIWLMPFPSSAGQPYLIHFTNVEGMIILAGFNWGKTWFESDILHELMHAEYQLEGRPSARAPADSDLWDSEEVEAGEFQRRILDLATKNAYSATASMIAGSTSATNLQEFMGGLTADNIRELDSTVPPARDAKESSMRVPFEVCTLGFVWVQGHPSSDPTNTKLEVYKIFRRARQLVVRGY
jgi:hypothetical protein